MFAEPRSLFLEQGLDILGGISLARLIERGIGEEERRLLRRLFSLYGNFMTDRIQGQEKEMNLPRFRGHLT